MEEGVARGYSSLASIAFDNGREYCAEWLQDYAYE